MDNLASTPGLVDHAITLKSSGQRIEAQERPEQLRVTYLDGWRGLAIICVLQSHFLHVSGIDSGRLGVDIFFVLSGLLMGQILFVKRTPLKRFYVRRASRVLPLFFFFVPTVYCLGSVVGVSTSTSELFSLCFFMRTYFPIEPGIWSSALPIQHIWSLNVEEHSYVILSLIAVIGALRGREAGILIFLAFAMMVLELAYVKLPQLRGSHLGTEVAGKHLMLAAGYSLVCNRSVKFVPGWLPMLTMTAACSCYLTIWPWWTKIVVSPILLAFTVNHLDRMPTLLLRLLSSRLLVWLGLISYSAYIWQQPLYRFVKQNNVDWYIGVVCLAIAIGVAF